MDIEMDGTCSKYEHKIELLNLKNYPPNVQIQN